jgi:hypothetical protein
MAESHAACAGASPAAGLPNRTLTRAANFRPSTAEFANAVAADAGADAATKPFCGIDENILKPLPG